MKKSITLSALLIASVLLSGCTTVSENSSSATCAATSESTSATKPDDTSTESENSEAEPDASEPEVSEPDNSQAELSFNLTGLMGEKIKPSEIVKISSVSGEQLTVADLTEDNWNYLTCEGFGYAAEPTGLCYNSLDTPDRFDADAAEFTGLPDAAPNIYRRVQPGDTICGLTVKSAKTDLTNELVSYPGKR